MIRGAIIGERFDGASFATFEVGDNTSLARALAACKRVAQFTPPGVLLWGAVDTGKTHLLVSLARVAGEGEDHWEEVEGAFRMVRAPRVEYWPILDLAAALRGEIQNGWHEVAERCEECDLLVLDDLGSERTTDYILEELARIIDVRYRRNRLIAAASNHSPKELVERYGDRIMSRLIGMCEPIHVEGEGHRLRERRKYEVGQSLRS